MWLKGIGLKNFKRLVDFQAQFSPGINVVKGSRNEMGKSTLLEGIVAALFHNPRSTAKGLKDYVSWGSTRQCQTSLEFENNGNRYLLEKDFDKGTVRLIDENTREELDTFKEISKKMAELLGTDSDGLFTCTSCIRQAQVSEISSGKEISESLEEVITGGEEGTLASQVIQKLDDKISEIKKGLDRPAKIPGVLASLRGQLEDSSRKRTDIENEVSKVEAQKIELVEVNKQLARVNEEYEKSKVWLGKNKQCKETEASIKELEHKYDEVEKLLGGINELMTKLERAEEALRSIEGLESEQQVSEIRRKLDAVQNRSGNIEKDLAMREEEVTETKDKLDRRKSLRFLGSGKGIATALTILIGGIIGALVVSLYFLSLAILGVVLLVVITTKVRTDLNRCETNISTIDERIKEMKEALGKLGQEENELLTEAKCSTVAEFDKKERDFKFWLEEKRSLENQLKGMLRGKTVEDFQKQKREITRDLAVKQAELTEDLIETRLSPEEYIELERRVQSLKVKQDELEDRKRDSVAVIKTAKFDAESQIKMEEELESLEEALKQEEKKVKVYGLARDFVSKAKDEALSSINDILREKIQYYFEIFTNGKYKQVEVKKDDKDNLEFWVYSDEKGDWAKPEELSGGVIDEFYLAFRLALAELIFGDKKPPLILDDPFVNFDSVRLANTLNFFKTLASDYQIIIFTLSDLYDKVADNIILLGDKERQPIA
jgi:DNA repair exonuclease SbcCD ATPase subunit